MDPVTTTPDEIKLLDDTQIGDLRSKIAERAEELKESDAVADIEELELLGDLGEALDNEAGHRYQEAADRADRRQKAMDRLAPPADPDAVDPEDAPVDPEAVDPDVDPEIPGEPAVDPAPEDAPIVAGDQAPVPVAASLSPSAKATLAALNKRQRTTKPPEAPKPDEYSSVFVATAHAGGKTPEGTVLTGIEQMADVIAKKRLGFKNIPDGAKEFLSIATAEKPGTGLILSHDAMENFHVIQEVREAGGVNGGGALVASGPLCAPPTPMYDFFRVAEAQNPVEQGLAVLQAPRGGVRFIVPPDYTTAAGAIGIEGVDYDISDPDDPEDKPCLHADCAAIDEEFVGAISQCVTFGNLQYKTFAEQVAAFLEDVAVAFASRKEGFYLDYIDGKSTNVTGIEVGYGFWRTHLYNLDLAAVGYRKRRGMKRGARLTVIEPDWALDAAKTDMVNDQSLGLNFASIPDSAVTDAYRQRGLDVIWANDSATGRAQKFNGAQNAGALNKYPGTIQSYIFAPGTFVRLDGGSLDVGLVRDSVLNKTNDLQLFMEEWIGAAMLGLESVRLHHTVCPSGGSPAAATLYACA